IRKTELTAERNFNDRRGFAGFRAAYFALDPFENAFGDLRGFVNAGNIERQPLKRTLAVILYAPGIYFVRRVINLYKKYAARFFEFADVRHLDRTGIESPIIDLVMHMR